MGRQISDALASFLPKWMANRVGKNTGYKVLWTSAVILDTLLERSIQGVFAAWPGYGTNTADTTIGLGRGLIQGEAETSALYEVRLQKWIDIWQAGSAAYPNRAALAQRIHEYLGNAPIVRIVNRHGDWITIDGSGNITFNNNGLSLGWDNQSNPERNMLTAPWWSDLWIIVYTPEWAQETRTLAQIATAYGTVDGWGNQRQLGCGQLVPRTPVDAILSLIWTWQGAHTNIRAVIWSYDATKFNPTVLASLCDGFWGQWAVEDTGTYQPRRGTYASYWVPSWSVPQ